MDLWVFYKAELWFVLNHLSIQKKHLGCLSIAIF